jgi:hypothetical protein
VAVVAPVLLGLRMNAARRKELKRARALLTEAATIIAHEHEGEAMTRGADADLLSWFEDLADAVDAANVLLEPIIDYGTRRSRTNV